jgi:hypothetical protein
MPGTYAHAMAPRHRRRGLDPERALEISIHGTAGRLAGDDVPTLEAIEQLRELAGDRVDLGSPLANPLHLKAAYLLVLASNGKDHAALVAAADESRRNAGGSAYSL